MAQDVLVVAETITTTTGLTAKGNVTVASGASLSLASGANLNIASGSLNVSGSVALDSSKITTDGAGNVVVAGMISGGGPASASVSVATASGTSIPIATRLVRVSATAATTSGSCTLAVGTLDGQEVTLVNESANNIIISGNMKGAAAQTVAANAGARFTWISTDTAWFHNT